MKKSVQGISFMRMESPVSKMHIGSFMHLDQLPDITHLRGRIENIITQYPKLKQVLPSREKDEFVDFPKFNLDDHFEVLVDSSIENTNDLFINASKIFSNGLDWNLPLWKVFIIHDGNKNLNSNNVILLTLIHHILVDGLGGLRLVKKICQDDDGRFSVNKKLDDLQYEEKKGWANRWKCLRKIGSILTNKLIVSPVNGSSSEQRLIVPVTIDRKVLLDIKRATNTQVPDILYALNTRVIRKYHLAKSIPVDKNIRAIVPLSTRDKQQDSDLDNAHTSFTATLPISIEDPVECLHWIHHHFQECRVDGSIEANMILSMWAEKLPSKIRKAILVDYCSKNNTIASIMPWSVLPLEVVGAKVIGNFGIVPQLLGHGLGIGYIIYGKSINISVIVDPAIIPDYELLVSYFNESIIELKKSLNLLQNSEENIGYVESPFLKS